MNKRVLLFFLVLVISGCTVNSNNNESVENLSLKDVFSVIKEKQNIDSNYFVLFSNQELDDLIGYGQMEYISESNNKIAVVVVECNSKENIEKCFRQAKERALMNARQSPLDYDSVTMKNRSIDGLEVSELIINDREGNNYHFFWKYKSKFIIQVGGRTSHMTMEEDIIDVVKSINFHSSKSESTEKNDSAKSQKQNCEIGLFGFGLNFGVTPLVYSIDSNGDMNIALENRKGEDVTIISVSCSDNICNDGWSGEKNLKKDEKTLIEVDNFNFVNIGNKGECYTLSTLIEYKDSNGMVLHSSGFISGVWN